MVTALSRWRLTQLPLLELFHALIYLFILTIGFFFIHFFCSLLALPISPARGIESGESWVVVLSGVVKIHLARQFISTHIRRTHPFIYLSGTIKINWFGLQTARLFCITVSFDFRWTGCWKRLSSATTRPAAGVKRVMIHLSQWL